MDTALRQCTCCFTGHRPVKLPWRYNESDERCIRLKSSIADALEACFESGIRRFICGMALGCDTYFAEAVLAMKQRHEGIVLEAAVPCLGQEEAWPGPSRERYYRLLEQCDVRTVLEHEYTPGCMERRNRYMVDSSRILLAVYTGGSGGTLGTIRYAMDRGLTVVQLPIES